MHVVEKLMCFNVDHAVNVEDFDTARKDLMTRRDGHVVPPNKYIFQHTSHQNHTRKPNIGTR